MGGEDEVEIGGRRWVELEILEEVEGEGKNEKSKDFEGSNFILSIWLSSWVDC